MIIRSTVLLATVVIMQCAFIQSLHAATVVSVPLNLITPDWSADQKGKIPVKVVNRDTNSTVVNGLPPASLQLEAGQYLITVAHLYDEGTKRLTYTGFLRVTDADVSNGRLSHTVELIGEHSLFGRWMDDEEYRRERAALVAKQDQLRVTREEAARLSDEVLRTLQTSGVDAAFNSAQRLNRQYRDHSASRTTLARFNSSVCQESRVMLTSTQHLQSAKNKLAKHLGDAACVFDVETYLREIEDIVDLENAAAAEVQLGQYVKSYALFGEIKRDYGHLVDSASLDNNLRELLKPLQGDKSYKPKLIRLKLTT